MSSKGGQAPHTPPRIRCVVGYSKQGKIQKKQLSQHSGKKKFYQ